MSNTNTINDDTNNDNDNDNDRQHHHQYHQEMHAYARQERWQRIWHTLLTVSALFAIGTFCVVGYHIVVRPPREIPVGMVSEYVPNVPRRFAVEQLAVSDWAQRRQDVSEDILFVIHDQDGTWWALLGLDMATGCFLHWDDTIQLFVAASSDECLSARYTPDGRFLSGKHPGTTASPMARLPVEIRDNHVIVIDSLLRDAGGQ